MLVSCFPAALSFSGGPAPCGGGAGQGLGRRAFWEASVGRAPSGIFPGAPPRHLAFEEDPFSLEVEE